MPEADAVHPCFQFKMAFEGASGGLCGLVHGGCVARVYDRLGDVEIGKSFDKFRRGVGQDQNLAFQSGLSNRDGLGKAGHGKMPNTVSGSGRGPSARTLSVTVPP